MALRVSKVLSAFLLICEMTRSENTVRYYRHHLRKLVIRVGRKEASRLRKIDLTSWAKTWHEFQAVLRCFAWAAKEAELIRKSPFVGVRLPPMGGRKRVLRPQEISQLLRGLRPFPRLFFLAMRETLARPQEIRSVRWCDLKSENPRDDLRSSLLAGRGLIVLQKFKSRDRRADGSRPRVLLISKLLGRAIVRRMDSHIHRGGNIFLNSVGEAWTANAVRCVMRRVRRRLAIEVDADGEKLTAYTIRHSTATDAAAGGVLDRALADLLGHVETKTTARYQHLCVGHLRSALERAKASQRTPR